MKYGCISPVPRNAAILLVENVGEFFGARGQYLQGEKQLSTFSLMKEKSLPSLVTLALTGTECIKDKQTNTLSSLFI